MTFYLYLLKTSFKMLIAFVTDLKALKIVFYLNYRLKSMFFKEIFSCNQYCELLRDSEFLFGEQNTHRKRMSNG
jgi:hypothetical protein